MAKLEKLTPAMLPEIHGLVLEGLDASDQLSDCERVFFTHGWSHEAFGYGLADGGKLVGILGMIFCERAIDGAPMPFCNLHSWYVKPEYRANSLPLLKPIMDLKHHTITDFSPGKNVIAISLRLGFKSIDRWAVVLPPTFRSDQGQAELLDLTDSAEQYADNLNAGDLQIYRDHRDHQCGCLLVRDENNSGMIVYSRIAKHLLPYCLVHYLGDPPLFARHHAAIRAHLMQQTGGKYVVVDARLLGDVPIPSSFRMQANEKICRSPRPFAQPVDSLYSEMVILKHSTLPTVRKRLRTITDRFVPRRVYEMLGYRA
jgi:hypothetical protein